MRRGMMELQQVVQYLLVALLVVLLMTIVYKGFF